MQKNIYSTAKYSGTDSGSRERYHFNVNRSYQERKKIFMNLLLMKMENILLIK